MKMKAQILNQKEQTKPTKRFYGNTASQNHRQLRNIKTVDTKISATAKCQRGPVWGLCTWGAEVGGFQVPGQILVLKFCTPPPRLFISITSCRGSRCTCEMGPWARLLGFILIGLIEKRRTPTVGSAILWAWILD